MKKLFFSLLLLLICIVSNAVSIEDIQKLSAKATAEIFPDADAVLLYDDQRITFELDGTANDIDDMYHKILTDKGVAEYRSIPLYFNEFYSKYHIEKIEIIRNNKIIPVDSEANSRISIDNAQMSANIYDPHDKILSINIPGLQKNDILHLKVRNETLRPRMKGFFTDISVLRSNEPILYYFLQYSAPEEMPLKSILVKNEVKGTLKRSEKFENGRHIYTFVAENVPQLIPEPNSPPLYLYCQRVLLSSAEKWEDISKWYYDLCENHINKVDDEMKSFVQDLIKDCKTPEEKLRKIFDFVSQQIRYMGVTTETEAPGYEPHDVNITFEKRYGVCRDKAALLVALLRIADIPACMTLFYAGSPKDPEVPNNYFNHAVVSAKLPGSNDYILMDPTDENTTEFLPAYGANKSYLAATKEGDTLRLSPEIDPEKNSLDIANNWTINNSGTLSGTTEITFNGINDNIYRDAFANWTKERTEEFFRLVFNRVFPDCEIANIVIYPSNIRDLRQILRVKFDISVKNFVTSSNNISTLPPHKISNFFGALAMQQDRVALAKRRYPLQFFSTASVNEKTSVRFENKSVNLQIPSFENFKNNVCSFNISAEFKDNSLSEQSSIALAKTLLTPDEYTVLKNSLEKVDTENNKKIFVVPSSVAGNAQNTLIELYRKEFDFTDARNWTEIITVRKKILDYAGVKSNAELIFDFDSKCENAELISAQVSTPDGKIHKISPTEVHVMDSGETSSAPHYSPRKIFTVKFPHIVPGSIIDYSLKITRKNMPFFNESFVFASQYDTLFMEFILKNIPPSVKFSPVPPNVENISDDKNITFRKKNIPRLAAENNQPIPAMFNDTVFASAVNFQEYCFRLANLLNIAAVNSHDAAAKTAEITASCKTVTEKITAIRDFIDLNIRHAGPSLNDYSWFFSKADDTLKRSYGNSADRAVLFKAMLDAAKIKTKWIVRAPLGFELNDYFSNSLRYFQNIYDQVFLYAYDNDKIVAVLNGNSRYAPVSQDNNYLQTGLNLTDKIPLQRTVVFKPQTVKKINYKISPDLQTAAEVEYQFSGKKAEKLRRFFAESNSIQKEQFFERTTLEFSRQAVVAEPWKVIDDKNTLVIKSVLKLKNFISAADDYAALDIPLAENLSPLLPSVSADRKTPLWLNDTLCSELLITVELPQNYTLAMPLNNNIRRNFSKTFFSYSMTREANKITIKASLIAQLGLIEAENTAELAKLKKFISQVQLNSLYLKRINN